MSKVQRITVRRPIPQIGERADEARKRGCGSVPDSINDDDTVKSINDRYPEIYAWTIWWTSGKRSGVRQETDPS